MSSRFALVGPVGAGKSTLFHALRGDAAEVRKTQAVEYDEAGVDTPGEFFSHPRLYHALIQSVSEAGTLVYVHPANERACRMPPGLLDVYRHRRRLIGAISKIDLPDADPEAAEALLRAHGFEGEIFYVSSRRPDTVAALRTALASAEAAPGTHGERP